MNPIGGILPVLASVKRNLGRLVASGQLRLAMQLAPDLMKRGSHQVGMSDESLMAKDVEDCLSVVIKAITKWDLPAEEVLAWCSAMLDTERMGFIARKPLVGATHRFFGGVAELHPPYEELPGQPLTAIPSAVPWASTGSVPVGVRRTSCSSRPARCSPRCQ